MSGEFSIEAGQFVVRKDGRLVLSTSGTLVQFLTTEQTYYTSAAYPDVPKGEGYVYEYNIDYTALGTNYAYQFQNGSVVLARPQEWSSQIPIAAVPAGADIFIGRITLSQSVAPSHAWGSESLVPRVPMGVAMQISGSLLIEQVRCFCRAMSVYINGGLLYLDLQQSCGPVSGNFGSWGQGLAPASDVIGGQNLTPSGAGKYVYLASSGTYISGTTPRYNSGVNPDNITDYANSMYKGGSRGAAYSDPTNYGSTYSVQIQGRFGRKS